MSAQEPAARSGMLAPLRVREFRLLFIGLVGAIATLGWVISLRTLFPSLALAVLALTVLIVVTQPAVRRARISPGRKPPPTVTVRRAG